MAWAAVAAAAAIILPGCDDGYSQSSPDAVVRSARLMVERGDAERLPDLLYADSKDMRALYRRLGMLLGNMEGLARAIQEKFPAEVEALLRRAEEAAASGQGASLLAQMVGGGRQRARRGGDEPGPAAGENARNAFDDALKQVFADPYGWLRRGQERLSTTLMTDDTAAILWDGKPLLAPIGMTMRLERGKWYAVPPLNVPGASRFLPQSREEYAIWASLIKVVDNVVLDLTADVESGRARSLDELSERAGEKIFIPAMLVFVAYGKAMDAREDAARAAPATEPSAAPAVAPAPGP